MDTVSMFNTLISESGFKLDARQGIFVSRQDAWQHDWGYFTLYDQATPFVLMDIHCEPIEFSTPDGRLWKIEFWKGKYGPFFTGAEVGIYTGTFDFHLSQFAHLKGLAVGANTACAGVEDWMLMSFTLKKTDGTILFTRNINAHGLTGNERHWWLTGFQPGEAIPPGDLVCVITIFFKGPEMLNAFATAIRKKGYTDQEFFPDKIHSSATIIFSHPRTKPQPHLPVNIDVSVTAVILYLRRVFGSIAERFTIGQVAAFLTQAYNFSTAEILSVLFNFSFLLGDVIAFLKRIYNDPQQIISMLLAAGFTASEVTAYFVNDAAEKIEDVIEWLKGADSSAAQVGALLRNEFDMGRARIAGLLADADYSVSEVGAFLKDFFDCGNKRTAELLQEAGFKITEIVSFFKNSLGKSAADVISILLGAGYKLSEIAAAIMSYYNLTQDELTALLLSFI